MNLHDHSFLLSFRSPRRSRRCLAAVLLLYHPYDIALFRLCISAGLCVTAVDTTGLLRRTGGQIQWCAGLRPFEGSATVLLASIFFCSNRRDELGAYPPYQTFLSANCYSSPPGPGPPAPLLLICRAFNSSSHNKKLLVMPVLLEIEFLSTL